MFNKRIIIILTICLVSKAYSRPDQYDNNENDYPDDTPHDYDEQDEGDADSENNGPSEPPVMKSKPLTLEVKPGSTVELPCLALNADDYALSWSRGKESLYLDSTAFTSEPERIIKLRNNSLIIKDVRTSDSSNFYTCKILAEDHPLELVHRLYVTNTPKELIKPESSLIRVFPAKRIEINEGGSIKFGCETTISPKPDIKWSMKGERLHNGERIDSPNGEFVMIDKATRHNSGFYQCLADDGSDKPPHEAIEIVVNYAPVIEVEHENVYSGVGMTSELTCKVHSHPRARVMWLKNGKNITNKKDKKHMTGNKVMRMFVIENTKPQDFGIYTCVAENQLGQASKDIHLTGSPAKPQFIGGEIAEDEMTMIVKWRIESFSPITEYKLNYRRKGDTDWKEVNPSVKNGKDNLFTVEYALKDLEPDSSYETTLTAKNDYGWSPTSSIHTFNKEYVSDEPQNVKGKDSSSDAISIQPTTNVAALLLVLLFSIFISV